VTARPKSRMNTNQSQTFRSYLNYQYGPDINRKFRILDKLHERIALAATQLTFLMQCRDSNIIPIGLRLKDPCNSRRSRNIIHQAETSLVIERINYMRCRKTILTTEIKNLETEVKSTVNNIDWNRMKASLDYMANRVQEEAKQRHTRKFGKLKPMERTLQFEKVVINKSKKQLSDIQQKVLSKGMNFAITPKYHPISEIVTNVECAAHFIPQEQRGDFRYEIRKAIDKDKRPAQNITKEEHQALKSLKTDMSIVILPADKGKATVVLDSEEYDKKIKNIISDNTKFKLIGKRNPITRIEKEAKQLVKRAGLEKIVDIKEKCKPPHIYGLPKIHKADTPLRPVVSCIGTTLHPLAKQLVNILNPLQTTIQSSIKNSKEFVDRIKTVQITNQTKLVSLDVVNLFTSVPIQEAISHVESLLETNNNWKDKTKLTAQQVIELTSYCLNSTIFQYQENFYKQTDGMAMGSPLSPVMCNLFMGMLEDKAIATAPIKPKLWLRYVDDTFVLWENSQEELQDFLNHMNKQNQAIQFTMEQEKDNSLPFLDVLVKKENEHLTTSVYRKPTHTDQYLNYKSNHNQSTKLGIIHSMRLRADNLCTSQKEQRKEHHHIQQAFRKNGYPQGCIDKVMGRGTAATVKDNTDYKGSVVIPYSGRLTEQIRRICKKYKVRCIAKSQDTIRNRLSKVAPKRPKELQQGIVYKIPLHPCSKAYIGETGRTMKIRLAEHKNALKNSSAERSGVAEHCLTCLCQPDFINSSILAKESNAYKRKIRETIEMEKAGQENIGTRSIEIGRIWNSEFLRRRCPK
jgi:Reverse transcriptase (RNA-dependent DNA polymerase)